MKTPAQREDCWLCLACPAPAKGFGASDPRNVECRQPAPHIEDPFDRKAAANPTQQTSACRSGGFSTLQTNEPICVPFSLRIHFAAGRPRPELLELRSWTHLDTNTDHSTLGENKHGHVKGSSLPHGHIRGGGATQR